MPKNPAHLHTLISAICLLIVAICSFGLAIVQYLSVPLSNATINWSALLWIGGIAGLLSLGHGVVSLLQAKGQTGLADEINKELAIFQAATPQNLESVAARMVGQLRQDLPGLTAQSIWPMLVPEINRLFASSKDTALVSAVSATPVALPQRQPYPTTLTGKPVDVPPPQQPQGQPGYLSAPITPMSVSQNPGTANAYPAINLADFSQYQQQPVH